MTETWLRANRRAVVVAQVIPAAVVLVAATASLAVGGAWRWMGAGLLAGGLLLLAAGIAAMRSARLSLCDDHLLLRLGGRAAQRVPIELVEGFLLGQGPSHLPGRRGERLETTTLVLRIAERAAEWEHVEVDPRLASWCGHYVTIRGTWCEPLGVELVNRLNARLHAAHQRQRGLQVAR